ncbi:INO80 complex subunit D [Merluccius polli]|uniref:INO80 complex subunit D n=1 Tax=Merluccius polli TaxID=89951 RepID=A0AA47P4P9_MERPO|nr:INO80 complex subunit D [Merluccius polli]
MYEGKHIHFSEVDNKPLCSYSPKLCKQRRLNGYAFCIRHVLEDKTAPFKQCEYVAKYNSQRCTNPIPKAEDRRYCNSHLQVLGFIPKKERKKKHDTLDEMRSRPHLESVALNITLPSLTRKVPNGGLDDLPASPPCTRLLPLTDGEVLDPFAFSEEDTDGEETGIPRKSASVRKKPQNHRLLLNQKLHHDTELFPPPPEHFSPSSRVHTAPLNSHPPRQHSGHHHHHHHVQPPPPLPQQHSNVPPFFLTVQPQGLLCNPVPPQTPNFLPPNAAPSPTQTSGPSLGRKPPSTATHLPSSCKDGASGAERDHVVVMRPTGFSPPPACLARLQHLVQLCAKRRQDHGDLFPHLGLDWSEDSGEDDLEEEEAEAERDRPFQSSWRPQDGLEEEGRSSRRTRLLRLCSYLQEKYKHMCRQERASMRQKRYRYAFRKALLHAASKDPHCAGQLIQELHNVSGTSSSAGPAGQQNTAASGICTGTTKGHACNNSALPFTRHCFQHILLNRSQQLFSSCTAKFADGQQCSIPVFDITHQTPLCEEHAKKMDNFLRGDGNRRVQHQQQQQRKPRKKTKPPALTKKHKKKRRRGPRRPQKPIPPALPQGNLGMPSTSLTLPSQASIRSPSTPDPSADELPDDITNEIADIPNDLELNQEDFSDVLPRLSDDLQDFDLFEGKNGELLPTTEEAEELVRALQAMGSYPESLVCLTSMGDLASSDGVDHRAMAVFPGPVQPVAMGDLLNGRMPTENFASLELDDNLLQSSAGHHFPPSPSSQPSTQPPSSGSSLTSVAATVATSNPALLAQSSLTERTFPRTHASQVLVKSDPPAASPQSSHYSSEHVPSPYSDNISSPHAGTFQTDPPLLLEVPLGGLPCPPRSAWNHLSVSINDPSHFSNLIGAESHLVSTSLSTPPAAATHSVTLQPMAALSAIPQQRGLVGLTSSPAPSPSRSPASSPHDLLTSTQPKQQLPQFSAAFGHQLASPHSGIPKDVQPSHSSTAPPAGFSIASATAASANSSTTTTAPPSFPQSN